jgi:hypothetical protein
MAYSPPPRTTYRVTLRPLASSDGWGHADAARGGVESSRMPRKTPLALSPGERARFVSMGFKPVRFQ